MILVKQRLLLMLALALGIGLAGVPAFAADSASYRSTREQYPVTTLADTAQVLTQIARHSGDVVEMDGAISGILQGGQPGYLLQVDPAQSVVVVMETADASLTIGQPVRVLARVSANGSPLTQLGMMPLDDTTGQLPEVAAAVAQVQQPPAPATAPDARRAEATAAPERAEVTAAGTRAEARVSTPAVENRVRTLAARIQRVNGDISADTATRIATCVMEKCRQHGVDSNLVFALMAQESRFDPRAVSPVGARGLGQLMPATAAGLGVRDSFDIEQNVDGTVRYLKDMMRIFGSPRMALAAYNAGPGNVQRYGGIPPFRETQNYVQRITTHYRQLTGSYL